MVRKEMRMVETIDLDALDSAIERDAQLSEPFLVLTVAASLIASLGLLADSAAVVIGAMLIDPGFCRCAVPASASSRGASGWWAEPCSP